MNAYTTLQVKKFNVASWIILIMVIISAFNILLTLANSDLYLFFTVILPMLLYGNGGSVLGGILATVVLLAYLACFFLMRRWRAFILVTLVLFIIDCLMIVWVIWLTGFVASYWLDIVFHAIIMYYLAAGTVAWGKLRRTSAEDFKDAEQELVIHRSGATRLVDESGGVVERGKTPLRFDSEKGRVLVKANYETLYICMKRSYGLTELIVNGHVYDEVQGVAETAYSLFAFVNNIRVCGKYNPMKFRMEIYANDILIAKKIRLA